MFDRRVKRSEVKRIRFHDLSDTQATVGLRAGVPVKVMSERLGHATPAFTLQQYAHVIPGMQAEAAQAIADLIADLPGKPEPRPNAGKRHKDERAMDMTTTPRPELQEGTEPPIDSESR